MGEKYKDKYLVDSIRMKGVDYSNNGGYYITICTKNMTIFFGKIGEGKMVLNECGKIVDKYWRGINHHYPFVRLDEYVVMPNHIHGIIFIEKNIGDEINGRDSINLIYTNKGGFAGKNNVMFNNSIGNIIRNFKGKVSFEIRKRYNKSFSWQSNYWDHIIRNKKDLERIRKYIIENPLKWEINKNYMERRD